MHGNVAVEEPGTGVVHFEGDEDPAVGGDDGDVATEGVVEPDAAELGGLDLSHHVVVRVEGVVAFGDDGKVVAVEMHGVDGVGEGVAWGGEVGFDQNPLGAAVGIIDAVAEGLDPDRRPVAAVLVGGAESGVGLLGDGVKVLHPRVAEPVRHPENTVRERPAVAISTLAGGEIALRQGDLETGELLLGGSAGYIPGNDGLEVELVKGDAELIGVVDGWLGIEPAADKLFGGLCESLGGRELGVCVAKVGQWRKEEARVVLFHRLAGVLVHDYHAGADVSLNTVVFTLDDGEVVGRPRGVELGAVGDEGNLFGVVGWTFGVLGDAETNPVRVVWLSGG